MSRILLHYLLPLLLPILLYFLWIWVARLKNTDGTPPEWRDGPWFWLIAAGCGLMIGGLVLTAFLGDKGEGVYQPPHVEDGKVVPGRVVPSK